jgi:ubiquinone/menaquinone biosynthesis C-methylase UbiE
MRMPRRPEPELMDDAAEAEAYAHADFRAVNEAFAERLYTLTEGLNVPKHASAVDLGTGPGEIALLVAAAMPQWRITAIDASEAMLRLARSKQLTCEQNQALPNKGRVTFILADAKRTHLTGHTFDVVFSNSILHHINETDALWAEVRRLAKPGALVFFRDLARPPSKEAALKTVETYARDESKLLREEYLRSLLSAYTPDEVRDQLRHAGLDSLQVEVASDRHLDVFGIAR